MRASVGWSVVLGVFVAVTACKKKEQEVPPPSPVVEAGGVVVTPPAVDAGVVPVVTDAAPVEPPPVEPPPAADATTPPAIEAGPGPDAAPVEPPVQDFVTETASAEGLGVESIELCSAVETRQCVGAKRAFAPGEMVWALLRLTNSTRAEAEVRVSYLPAGVSPEPGRGLALRVALQERYTTFSKASKAEDGMYDVIVATPTGTEIARARFQVGTGIAAVEPLPPVEPPPVVEPGTEPATLGTGLGVASIELCKAIESRRCGEPSTVFAPGEMVWALLRVTNPEHLETQLLVSYIAAGGSPAPGEGLALNVPAQERYTTFSKAGKSNPGQYEVVVCAPDGRELARSAFEVR